MLGFGFPFLPAAYRPQCPVRAGDASELSDTVLATGVNHERAGGGNGGGFLSVTTGAVRRGAITEVQAGVRLALLDRRQQSLARTPPPQVYAVLDESCIRQHVGGPGVMAEQLDHLAMIADRPNVVVQVAPFRLGERRSLNKPVTLVTMVDRSHMSYAESAHSGQLERDMRFVGPLLTSYHQLQVEALSQADSVAMISQV